MRHIIFCLTLLTACDASNPVPSKATADAAASSMPGAGKATGSSSSAQNAAQLPGYKGTYARDPALSPVRVAAWPVARLRIKRNEIYARYGRAFKSADLNKHFTAQSWYRVSDSYSDALLTKNDRANVALIKSFEGDSPQRDGSYGQLMFMNDRELIISDGESMYAHEGEERYYASRGPNHVITWSGPRDFNLKSPSLQNPELWTWKGGSWTRASIPLPQG